MDKEVRRAEAKALALIGKLSGLITTLSYSSFHASSNSIVGVVQLVDDKSGDNTRFAVVLFLSRWQPPPCKGKLGDKFCLLALGVSLERINVGPVKKYLCMHMKCYQINELLYYRAKMRVARSKR